MLKEVFERRFSKIIKDKKQGEVMIPDLVIIDGGKGQYSVGRKILDEYGFHEIPIIAIAKGKNRNKGDETFFHKSSIVKLNKREPLLFFLQRLRDEAHRFAISSHRMKRKKNLNKIFVGSNKWYRQNKKKGFVKLFWFCKSC